MITDLNSCSQKNFGADICVVGTGVAGMALASRFLGYNRSVIFVESGGTEREKLCDELNLCEIQGLCLDGSTVGRTRMIGGTSNCWGGQLLPLEARDFERRQWVSSSGWPLKKSDLESYYLEALRFFGSDQLNFDSDIFKLFSIDLGALKSDSLRFYFSKWSPHPNLRLIYLSKFQAAEQVRLLYHANLIDIELSPQHDRVLRIEVRNQDRVPFFVEADSFVLCLGGIDNARVLLSCNKQIPEGVGNASGLVGRYFQDHPTVHIGNLEAVCPEKIHALLGDKIHDGRVYSARFSPVAEFDEPREMLNTSAYMYFDYPQLLRKRMILNLWRHMRGGGEVPAGMRSQLGSLLGQSLMVLPERLRVGRQARFGVMVMTEQEPCLQSRISLSAVKDRYGVPRAAIDWRLTPKTSKTVQLFSNLIRDEFGRLGFGHLKLFPHITEPCGPWQIFPHEAFHHIGSTRMARKAEDGVVDENCQVFGLENLFVVGSSVFPTGGHSNPTLTIAALAFRLADRLHQDFNGTGL